MRLSAAMAVLAVLAGVGSSVARAQPRPARPSVRNLDARATATGANATMPGFETLADGSSRLFVELSKSVPYDTKASRGAVTYVLKGTRVLKRNNTNPLVTVHFNTPVTTARLVPHGRDVWFVVDLRADVTPAVSIEAGKDGTAVMRIELPKGEYLGPSRADSTASRSDATKPSPSASPSGGVPSSR